MQNMMPGVVGSRSPAHAIDNLATQQDEETRYTHDYLYYVTVCGHNVNVCLPPCMSLSMFLHAIPEVPHANIQQSVHP